jgi:hypothetical protein
MNTVCWITLMIALKKWHEKTMIQSIPQFQMEKVKQISTRMVKSNANTPSIKISFQAHSQ